MSATIDRLNELEGRIEAVSILLLQLTARLEMNNIIDGTGISNALRHKAGKIDGLEPVVLNCSKAVLLHLADQLDDARNFRQKQES